MEKIPKSAVSCCIAFALSEEVCILISWMLEKLTRILENEEKKKANTVDTLKKSSNCQLQHWMLKEDLTLACL